MTHVSLTGILLAVALSTASLAHAQTPPDGYQALDAYAQDVKTVTEPLPEFVVERGASLRTTLEQWAEKAGWQPIAWKLPEDTDFTLGAAHTFKGEFTAATRAFVAALGPEAELRVRFNQGNRLMVVEPLK